MKHFLVCSSVTAGKCPELYNHHNKGTEQCYHLPDSSPNSLMLLLLSTCPSLVSDNYWSVFSPYSLPVPEYPISGMMWPFESGFFHVL